MRTEEGPAQALGRAVPVELAVHEVRLGEVRTGGRAEAGDTFVKTLGGSRRTSAAEIAAKMPADYAGGDPKLYDKAVADSIGMFNGDGMMPADAAQNVLRILGQYSKNVAPVKDRIDLSATYTTRFVETALREQQQ